MKSLSVRVKILAAVGIMAVLMAASGVLSIFRMNEMAAIESDLGMVMLPTTVAAQAVEADMLMMDSGIQGYLSDPQQSYLDLYAVGKKTLADDMAILRTNVPVAIPDDVAEFAKLDAALAPFQAEYDRIVGLLKSGKPDEARSAFAASGDLQAAFDAPVEPLQQALVKQAAADDGTYDSTQGAATTLVILFTILAAAIGLGLGFWIARGISRGAQAVQATVGSLADHCATWLAEGLGRMRDNDLTYAITPVTERIGSYSGDEIGRTAAKTDLLRDKFIAAIESYNAARTGLGGTITEVQEASTALARTSGQLTTAATQAGAATQQIATTIQQVAAGAADQAQAASSTSTAVADLSGLIGDVAGAADQVGERVEASARTINDLTTAISEAENASMDVATATSGAGTAAAEGATAVRDTVAGMNRIRDVVAVAAARVTELGAKGEQIGAIVETIDDIAEQTNLLALNAAIEAARAGEMGKGFAVVADEVRKLAERSGRATKEIAGLIAEVQAGTKDAVAAMESGAREVATGTDLAARSGTALEQINDAVHAVQAAVARIVGSVTRMQDSSRSVVDSMDSIAGLAEKNRGAAVTMRGNSGEVTRSVESIAAVSEENSAAAEEVSAATEEMSAQTEEVVASAQELASMASQLDALVARFRLESRATSPGTKIVPLRKVA